jgi:hypothetical protein
MLNLSSLLLHHAPLDYSNRNNSLQKLVAVWFVLASKDKCITCYDPEVTFGQCFAAHLKGLRRRAAVANRLFHIMQDRYWN